MFIFLTCLYCRYVFYIDFFVSYWCFWCVFIYFVVRFVVLLPLDIFWHKGCNNQCIRFLYVFLFYGHNKLLRWGMFMIWFKSVRKGEEYNHLRSGVLKFFI